MIKLGDIVIAIAIVLEQSCVHTFGFGDRRKEMQHQMTFYYC